MAYPVVWLNQSSKFSLRYMYIVTILFSATTILSAVFQSIK